MDKDTSKLIEELGLCEDFHSFYEQNQQHILTQNLSAALNEFIVKKGLKKSQVIIDSELAEVYAYQIFSGRRTPDRSKLLALCIAMQLEFDEVQALLKCAGYPPLYPKLSFDSIVIYGIFNHFSVSKINEILFTYKEKTIG